MIKKFINDFWNDIGRTPQIAASASMFYIAIDGKNKTIMKVTASNINIKIHQLFTKQRILSVRVISAQRKISGDLTRTCS